MRGIKIAALAAAAGMALGLLSTPASATEIHVSSMALANGYEMVGFTSSATWGGGTEYTGQQQLTVNYGTTDIPAAHFDIFAWCVDVFNNINIGGNDITYTLGTLGVTNAGDIEKIAAWGDQQLASGPNALISAAVQAEIWILEYGVALDANTIATNQDLVTELAFIQGLLPGLPAGTGNLLSGFTGGGSVAQSLYAPAVPEPASLALLGTGLAGLGLLRRKRQAKRAGGTV